MGRSSASCSAPPAPYAKAGANSEAIRPDLRPELVDTEPDPRARARRFPVPGRRRGRPTPGRPQAARRILEFRQGHAEAQPQIERLPKQDPRPNLAHKPPYLCPVAAARGIPKRVLVPLAGAAAGRSAMDKINVGQEIDHHRRRLLGAAAMTVATARLGMCGPAAAQPGKAVELPAIKPGTNTSFPSMKQIDAGVLNVGYAEAGPADGPAVILLHGWPYDIHSYVDVAPLLKSAGYRVIVPYLRGYGATRFLSSETFRNGQQSALALDAIALMDALKIDKATIGGIDWGARTADIIAALWPERCKALVSVSGYLIGSQQAGKIPLPSKAELQWWRQFYFATDRGRAGYDKYRRDFARLIWQLASPKWSFDDATFDRSAAAFENPDHVAIVIHNYRWRLGLAEGEQKYDDLEQRLAQGPIISVPAITLEGNANGAPHPEPGSYAKKLSGKYAHRLITGGVEHNLPQEAPNAVMIEAYKAGVPGNGQPFPDGSKIAKIEWKPKKSTEAPFYVRVPNVLQDVFFIEKNTKRFPDTNGCAYAQFNYDPPSDTFAPDGSGAKCGYACHTIVSGKDYIFTAYGKR